MDRFLQDQNIALYRRLLNSSTDEAERRTIFKLLAEEMDKLKNEKKRNTGQISASRLLSLVV
jgi:hypothetical protein